MDYHAQKRSENGVMQMLGDGSTFRGIDERWPILKENLIMLNFQW